MLRPFITVILLLASIPCLAQNSDARSELLQGVTDYKNARYESAIQHFQRAADLDPALLNARLYLATAYAQQYIPGADTPENIAVAERAITEYKRVLEADSANVNSIKGIAYLYLMMKKFDDSKSYYLKASEVDPSDPENYYAAGVIDWTITYQPRMMLYADLGMKPVDEGFITKPQCWQLRERSLSTVEDGIRLMTKALELRPDYDDAMAYMNLLLRERAAIQCGNQAASNKDQNEADKWVDLTMETKRKKVEAAKKQD
ncbi:MAG TPA: hypothetical protein VF135_00150 [Terriglobales bacterium]